MDFAKKIEAAEAELLSIKNDVAEIIGIAEAEERDLSDEESILIEHKGEEGEALTKRIKSLKDAEKVLGLKAVQKSAPAVVKAHSVRPTKEREKGELIWKMATNTFLAHQEKISSAMAVEKYYGHDVELCDIVKSAVNPAATDVAGWAAELVDDALQGWLDALRGESLGWDLLASAGIMLNFDGLGSIKVPTREGANTDVSAAWTGERDAIPVKRMTVGQQTIYPYKWAVISTFSKELNMRSTPQIESLIRTAMMQDTGTALDNYVFSDLAAVTGYRPAAVWNGVTGTASAGATAADMNTDIVALLQPLIDADCFMQPVIYMNPGNVLKMSTVLSSTGEYIFRDELSSGRLYGVPVRQSTNIPSDQHLVVDVSQLASAVSAPTFEVNDSATLVEIDDAGPNATDNPAMEQTYPRADQSGQVGDAATWNSDPLNTEKAPIRSLFQTETVAVKNVQYLSWHRMRTECVNRITGVAY
jgi:HK97 family phage major capsid protein